MSEVQVYCQYLPPSVADYRYAKLDLQDGDPIKITLAIEESGAVSSAYTQTFRIPMSFNNDLVFKGSCDFNNITFNPRKRIPTYINISGGLFSEGYIELLKVIRNPRNNTCYYELSYFGETADFKSKLGEKTLFDLDLSDIFHTRDKTNIELSWEAMTVASFQSGTGTFSDGLLDGNVLYPLVEYGYDYEAGGNTIINTINNTISSLFCPNSFVNPGSPLFQEQLKPLPRVKYVWDKIFYEAGFTYSSNFLVSPRFYCLYLLADGIPRGRQLAAAESKAVLQSSFDYFAVDFEYKDFRQGYPYEIVYSGNLIKGGGQSGQYESGVFDDFQVTWDSPQVRTIVEFTTSGVKVVEVEYQVDFHDFTLGSSVYAWPSETYTFSVFSSGPGFYYNSYRDFTDPSPPVITLDGGSRYQIRNRMKLTLQSGTGTFKDKGTAFQARNMLQWIIPNTSSASGIQPQLSRKMKQIDFIISIVRKFKLMLQPDPLDKTLIRIEPFVDWIQSGTKIDWSKKLDHGSDLTAEASFMKMKRVTLLTDKGGNDWPNTYFTKQNNRVYGEYKIDTNYEVLDGQTTISTEFSPLITTSYPICYNPPSKDDAEFVIVSVSSDNDPYAPFNNQKTPIEYRPRICFYNGTASCSGIGYGSGWWLKDDGGGTSSGYLYQPVITNAEYLPGSTTSTNFDINFNPESFLQPLGLHWSPVGNSAALEYYNDFFNLYYDLPYDGFNNRIVQCKLYLTDEDVIGFQFNTRVWLYNSWWLVLKISNYTLGTGGLTDVELLQLGYSNVEI